LSRLIKYFYKYYILESLYEIVTALALVALIIFSLNLSIEIDINALPKLTDDGIFYFFTSILVFFAILVYFTTIIHGYREQLGIYDTERQEYKKNFNTIIFILLAYLFVFAIYILLDVFFGEVYLFFGFYYLFTLFNSTFDLNIPSVTDVGRAEAYVTLRNGIFDIIFIFFVIVPTLALLRMILIDRQEQDKKHKSVKNDTAKKQGYVLKRTILTIIPLLTLFWIIPVAIVSIWEVLQQDIRQIDILKTFLEAFAAYLVDPFSILFGNFLVITLIAIIAVGFAEALLLETIFYFTAADPNTGARIKAVIQVITVVFVWLGFFFSNLGKLWDFLIQQIRLALPAFPFPDLWLFLEETVFSFISEVIETWIPILTPVTLLFLPLYIIVTGLYRFYSVTIVTDMLESDRFDYFIILITTVYVLIFVELLSVLFFAPSFSSVNAPLKSFSIEPLIVTMIDILGIVESIFFIIGVIYLPFYVYQQRQKYQDQNNASTSS